MACYIVFQSALKLLIVEFARIFYTNVYAKLSNCSKLVYLSQRRVDNAREGLGSSEMLTINLHGIGRHTRRLGPGIPIYFKVCWLLNLIAGLYRCSKYTILELDISRCSSVCDPFIILLEVYGLFLLATRRYM